MSHSCHLLRVRPVGRNRFRKSREVGQVRRTVEQLTEGMGRILRAGECAECN
jgi:hypothetical protein